MSTVDGQEEGACAGAPMANTRTSVSPRAWEPWRDIVAAEDVYFTKRAAMFAAGAPEQLRLAMEDSSGAPTAMRILRDLPVEITMDLIEPVFGRATWIDGSMMLGRELLARLDPDWLFVALPPVIERRLSTPETDYGDFRAVAAVLSELGQNAHLRTVVAQAALSLDQDIREVARDFREGA